MKPEDAQTLINWYPRLTHVETRKGFSEHCDTGETSQVLTLATLDTGSTTKLIAVCNGKFFDVTTSSPSTLATGLTGSEWVHTHFGNRLFFVNGTDAAKDYDGSTLSSTSWTGVTPANLDFVTSFKSRLYFVEKNSQSFWYGSVDAVTGALTEFDLAQTGTFGGTLYAIGSLPIDGGSGPDDVFWALMSSGELILYSGSNPGSDFSRIGVFKIGEPIAKKAIERVGNDVYIVTSDGIVSLQKVLPYGRAGRNKFSDKIVKAAKYATDTYSAQSGWCAKFYPKKGMLIFNVPISSSRAEQYVCNLDTGAWCKFKNQNAGSWALMSKDLYFGGKAGKIYKADTGTSDDGAVIAADAITAWNYFGSRAYLKKFNMYRPILNSTDTPGVVAAIGVDFDNQIATNPVSSNPITSDAVWDTAVWDTAIWAGGSMVTRSWEAAGGVGYCAALRMKSNADDQQIEWNSTNFIYEPGGLI